MAELTPAQQAQADQLRAELMGPEPPEEAFEELESAWYHRGPCCRPCGICGTDEHLVWNPDGEEAFEVHVCAHGCDGITWKEALNP
jgi:hypothetical protein